MPRKKNLNPQNLDDLNRMRELLQIEKNEDPADFEDLGDESDIDEEDGVEVAENDSCTEQDGENSSEDEEVPVTKDFYLGRDKSTKWSKRLPSTKRRSPVHRPKVYLPGVIGSARTAKTALECWQNFFTDEILETIVSYTNQYMDTVKESYSRERDIKYTNIIEIKAFIGLLYLAGVYKSNRLCLEELWGQEGDGIEKFGLVMNIKRFKTLVRCLRFDDIATRSERKALDCLAPIRDVFEKFVANCQSSYSLGENVTIDEMLLGFRGRCSFRQYIPSKPNKHGIKMFALVDAKITYIYNLEIYGGKQPEGPFCVSNKPSEVVKRMAKPLFGSGRNITADNWFTDFNLVKELKKEKLSYVGSVRKSKRFLPFPFVDVQGREQNTSRFGFNDGFTLVSYTPRKGKNVILLSSLYFDNTVDAATGDKTKPQIITFYNATKGGVDTADQMCAHYNVHRNSKRWPMVIFFTMLNIAGINSQIVYLGNQLEPMNRRQYLKRLAHELVIEEMQRRIQMKSGLNTNLQMRLKRFLPADDREKLPPAPRKRRKCTACSLESGKRRLSNYNCRFCTDGVCLSHANILCEPCFSGCKLPGVNQPEVEDSD